jgi:acetyltransferase-like isoleucine patch superfamily enzyme
MASIISAGTTSGTSLNLSADTSGVLQLATNGTTTAVTIDTSQNVGIGTASPGAKLEVAGGVRSLRTGSTAAVLQVINDNNSWNISCGTTTQVFAVDNNLVGRSFYVNPDNNFVVNQNIGIGNTTPTTSGTGITFPASQSASSNANTLDDYEEGNWTPVVQGVTTPGTASYTSQIGRYVKIGRQVTITLDINYSSATGTGIFQIAGLPFSSSSAHPSTGSVMTSNLDWNTGTMVTLYKPGNNAVLELYSSSDNSGWLQMNMDAAGEIIGSVTYFTAT